MLSLQTDTLLQLLVFLSKCENILDSKLLFSCELIFSDCDGVIKLFSVVVDSDKLLPFLHTQYKQVKLHVSHKFCKILNVLLWQTIKFVSFSAIVPNP